MKFEILNQDGTVANVIVASLGFVEQHHAGRYREVVEPVPDPVSTVPQSLTRAQAKLALLQKGLLGQVPTVIAAIQDPTQRAAAEIEWADRLNFERHNPTLLALAAGLGLDEAELDELFVLGATL